MRFNNLKASHAGVPLRSTSKLVARVFGKDGGSTVRLMSLGLDCHRVISNPPDTSFGNAREKIGRIGGLATLG